MFRQVDQTLLGSTISYPKISKETTLRKTLFEMGSPLSKIHAPLVSNTPLSSIFLAQDCTSLYRATSDVITGIPHSQPTSLQNLLTQTGTKMDYHAFGSASALNSVIGLIQMKQDFDKLAYVEAIGDKKAVLMNRLSLVKDGSLAGAGVSFAAFRPLSMASAIKGVSSTSLLGRVTSGVLFIGMIFYALFFAFGTVVLGIQFHEEVKFSKKLKNAESLAEQIEVLQKQLNVNPARLFDKMVEKEMPKFAGLSHEEQRAKATAAAREALIHEAFAQSKEGMRALIKELGIEGVSEERLEAIVQSAIAETYSGASPEAIKEFLKTAGLQMKIQKEQLKKSSKLGRVLDSVGLQALKELGQKDDLVGRVRRGDEKATEEAKALIEVIKGSNKSKMTYTGIVLGAFIVGIIAMILPLIFAAGIGLIVSAVTMLVCSLSMMAIDGYDLMQSYKSEKPARHDKKMMILSTVVGIASFLTVAALAATGVVTFGTFPLVVLIVLAALWLGQNAVTFYVMNRNEKKHKLENPTLEAFLEALKTTKKEEEILEMFNHFPKEIKEMIVEALPQMSFKREGLTVATQETIQKIEKAKAERLEELRVALVPHLVQ